MKIELMPLVGAKIEGAGEINFKQTIQEVKSILGESTKDEGRKLFYDQFEFRIDFDKKGKLEFIEMIYGPNCERAEVVIYDIDPFKLPAQELVDLLTVRGGNEVDDSEAPYSYAFPQISVGIWRDLTEETMLASIEELRKTGEYEQAKDNYDEDLEKSKFFGTIGIGVKKYYE
ncbi:MAG TPA: hypothetical protein VM802_21940 [Chitinophaga sp.]|uniref:hypothetical protein n=1 Tax=Chitinophaga sp. TaxID=1869181 RepID=UPI002C07834F|nr:hypothetical protein [Chitinophaga sp.]HVI47547.1 hypothetical protein [Chitinophaga sp.]